jgi:hypothetical protein
MGGPRLILYHVWIFRHAGRHLRILQPQVVTTVLPIM